MDSETEQLLYDSMMDCYKKGIEIGELCEKSKQYQKQLELQRLLHRNLHVIFKPICRIIGHRFDPLWCVCKICKMTQEELEKTVGVKR